MVDDDIDSAHGVTLKYTLGWFRNVLAPWKLATCSPPDTRRRQSQLKAKVILRGEFRIVNVNRESNHEMQRVQSTGIYIWQ